MASKLSTAGLVLSVTLCFLFTVGAWREFESEQLLNRPGITSPESSKNLGVIPVGGSGKAVFDLQNIGPFPITIVDISRSCGCTKTNLPKKALAMGEVLQLEVVVEPAIASGDFQSQVLVEYIYDGHSDSLRHALKLAVVAVVGATSDAK